ncbi:MAG: RNA-binding S4 domain-containing protein [Lachnospiraceae bacterium]|jgi:ribosome-associated protein|nr:RNA-binding S4 domain-containing protein [Lachnospiraceae bacterium]
METVTIRDEFIKLGQALKLAGICDSGVDAKELITDGEARVNGEVDLRRGRKLYDGDVVEVKGQSFRISAKK